jgi:putative oxidoreductase
MSAQNTRSTDLALLILRAGAGSVIFAHGALKLFGWFGDGGGLEATAAGFDSIGFSPGRTNAVAAGVAEAGGGALLALGLATPAASAASAGALVVATAFHAPNGFFFADGGYEFPATLALTAVALGISGPGAYSLDERLGRRYDRPWMRAAALALVAPAARQVLRRRASTLRARGDATAADVAADSSEVME